MRIARASYEGVVLVVRGIPVALCSTPSCKTWASALHKAESAIFLHCCRREEQAAECRRLHRELDLASAGLTHSQRAQRAAAAGAAELEDEAERMQAARDAMHSELAAAQAKAQRLQVGCS